VIIYCNISVQGLNPSLFIFLVINNYMSFIEIKNLIKRVVKDIFVTRDRPFLFPVKCEIAIFSLANRDFHSRREP